MVYSTVWPSGITRGSLRNFSPRAVSGSASFTGALPSLGTRQIAPSAEKTISPAGPHAVPAQRCGMATIEDGPPLRGMRRSLPLDRNESDAPSLENSTSAASSVPGTGRASSSSSRRTKSILACEPRPT